MAETSIEWTEFSLNPGIYGCSRFGVGCDNCYAIGVAKGLEDKGRGIAAKNPDAPPSPYAGVSDGTDWTGPIRIDPIEKAVARILAVPKARNGEPRRVFVTSMADFLHESIPLDWIVTCIEAMAQKPDHRWQVLTKRGQRWPEVSDAVVAKLGGWPDNVWAGLSVAHQPDTRLIRHLLRVPATVRFLSVEPLVGPVEIDFRKRWDGGCEGGCLEDDLVLSWDGADRCGRCGYPLGGSPRSPISWVIVGGESGPNARPMHPEWVRSLRDQCVAAGVPFFFKQWGAHGPSAVNLTTGLPALRQFDTYGEWVGKASTWINERKGDICVDTKGRILTCGADFMRARDEGAFPVAVLRPQNKNAAGRILDGREWSEVPRG